MMPVLTSSNVQDLEAQIESLKKRLVEARKALPREEVRDYEFTRVDSTKVRLSALFGSKDDLILVHNMGKSCPYCTLWADGLNGLTRHLESRAAFALVSADDHGTAREFAVSRGWQFDVLSAEGSTFTQDMGFWNASDGYWPGYSTFRRDPDGKIYRVACAFFGPGDDYCAVWPMFDLLQDGPNGWEPEVGY